MAGERRIGAVAAMVVAASSLGPGAAAEAQPTAVPGVASCLWSALPTATQLRLELAAKTRGGLETEDLAQIGGDGIAEVLAICEFPPNADNMALLAQFWAAKASTAARRSDLGAAGVEPALADAALEAAAPFETRASFAVEIVERRRGAASAAIRFAIDELAVTAGPLSRSARRAAAEYYVAVVLADGLAQATPSP